MTAHDALVAVTLTDKVITEDQYDKLNATIGRLGLELQESRNFGLDTLDRLEKTNAHNDKVRTAINRFNYSMLKSKSIDVKVSKKYVRGEMDARESLARQSREVIVSLDSLGMPLGSFTRSMYSMLTNTTVLSGNLSMAQNLFFYTWGQGSSLPESAQISMDTASELAADSIAYIDGLSAMPSSGIQSKDILLDDDELAWNTFYDEYSTYQQVDVTSPGSDGVDVSGNYMQVLEQKGPKARTKDFEFRPGYEGQAGDYLATSAPVIEKLKKKRQNIDILLDRYQGHDDDYNRLKLQVDLLEQQLDPAYFEATNANALESQRMGSKIKEKEGEIAEKKSFIAEQIKNDPSYLGSAQHAADMAEIQESKQQIGKYKHLESHYRQEADADHKKLRTFADGVKVKLDDMAQVRNHLSGVLEDEISDYNRDALKLHLDTQAFKESYESNISVFSNDEIMESMLAQISRDGNILRSNISELQATLDELNATGDDSPETQALRRELEETLFMANQGYESFITASTEKVNKLRDRFEPAEWMRLKANFTRLKQSISRQAYRTCEYLWNIIPTVSDMRSWTQEGSAFMEGINTAKAGFYSLFTDPVGFISAVFESISTYLSGDWVTFKSMMDGIRNIDFGLNLGIASWVSRNLRKAGQGISDTAESISSSWPAVKAKGILSDAFGGIAYFIKQAFYHQTMAPAMSYIVNSDIVQTISAGMTDIIRSVQRGEWSAERLKIVVGERGFAEMLENALVQGMSVVGSAYVMKLILNTSAPWYVKALGIVAITGVFHRMPLRPIHAACSYIFGGLNSVLNKAYVYGEMAWNVGKIMAGINPRAFDGSFNTLTTINLSDYYDRLMLTPALFAMDAMASTLFGRWYGGLSIGTKLALGLLGTAAIHHYDLKPLSSLVQITSDLGTYLWKKIRQGANLVVRGVEALDAAIQSAADTAQSIGKKMDSVGYAAGNAAEKAAVGAAQYAYDETSGIRESIGEAAQSAGNAISGVASSVGSAIGSAAYSAANAAAGVAYSGAMAAEEAYQAASGPIGEAASSVGSAIGEAASSVGSAIGSAAYSAANAVAGVAYSGATAAEENYQAAAGAAPGIAQSAGNAVGDAAYSAANAGAGVAYSGATAAEEAYQSASASVMNLPTTAPQAVADGLEWLRSGVGNMARSARSNYRKLSKSEAMAKLQEFLQKTYNSPSYGFTRENWNQLTDLIARTGARGYNGAVRVIGGFIGTNAAKHLFNILAGAARLTLSATGIGSLGTIAQQFGSSLADDIGKATAKIAKEKLPSVLTWEGLKHIEMDEPNLELTQSVAQLVNNDIDQSVLSNVVDSVYRGGEDCDVMDGLLSSKAKMEANFIEMDDETVLPDSAEMMKIQSQKDLMGKSALGFAVISTTFGRGWSMKTKFAMAAVTTGLIAASPELLSAGRDLMQSMNISFAEIPMADAVLGLMTQLSAPGFAGMATGFGVMKFTNMALTGFFGSSTLATVASGILGAIYTYRLHTPLVEASCRFYSGTKEAFGAAYKKIEAEDLSKATAIFTLVMPILAPTIASTLLFGANPVSFIVASATSTAWLSYQNSPYFRGLVDSALPKISSLVKGFLREDNVIDKSFVEDLGSFLSVPMTIFAATTISMSVLGGGTSMTTKALILGGLIGVEYLRNNYDILSNMTKSLGPTSSLLWGADRYLSYAGAGLAQVAWSGGLGSAVQGLAMLGKLTFKGLRNAVFGEGSAGPGTEILRDFYRLAMSKNTFLQANGGYFFAPYLNKGIIERIYEGLGFPSASIANALGSAGVVPQTAANVASTVTGAASGAGSTLKGAATYVKDSLVWGDSTGQSIDLKAVPYDPNTESDFIPGTQSPLLMEFYGENLVGRQLANGDLVRADTGELITRNFGPAGDADVEAPVVLLIDSEGTVYSESQRNLVSVKGVPVVRRTLGPEEVIARGYNAGTNVIVNQNGERINARGDVISADPSFVKAPPGEPLAPSEELKRQTIDTQRGFFSGVALPLFNNALDMLTPEGWTNFETAIQTPYNFFVKGILANIAFTVKDALDDDADYFAGGSRMAFDEDGNYYFVDVNGNKIDTNDEYYFNNSTAIDTSLPAGKEMVDHISASSEMVSRAIGNNDANTVDQIDTQTDQLHAIKTGRGPVFAKLKEDYEKQYSEKYSKGAEDIRSMNIKRIMHEGNFGTQFFRALAAYSPLRTDMVVKGLLEIPSTLANSGGKGIARTIGSLAYNSTTAMAGQFVAHAIGGLFGISPVLVSNTIIPFAVGATSYLASGVYNYFTASSNTGFTLRNEDQHKDLYESKTQSNTATMHLTPMNPNAAPLSGAVSLLGGSVQ